MPKNRDDGATVSPAVRILRELRADGFTLDERDSRLIVAPASRLEPGRRAEIAAHRDAILEEMRQEADWQAREEALSRLPPVEWEGATTAQMREVVLMRLPDGTYLAALPEEVTARARAGRDGFAPVANPADSDSGSASPRVTTTAIVGVQRSLFQ